VIDVPIPSDYVSVTRIYRFDRAALAWARDRGGWPLPSKYIPMEPSHEIRQWLYENDIRATLVVSPFDNGHVPYAGIVLRFTNPDEAFAFRMRWSATPSIPRRRIWTNGP
jgi:hypothetical protein